MEKNHGNITHFQVPWKKKKSRRASEDDFGHADLASKTLKEK